MKLDTTFANEIKKFCNGDGSREYKFAVLKDLEETAADLAKRYEFDDCLKKHGRAKVALCIASFMGSQQHRFEQPQVSWALAVLELWVNRTATGLCRVIPNIHPAILADNSLRLRKATTA